MTTPGDPWAERRQLLASYQGGEAAAAEQLTGMRRRFTDQVGHSFGSESERWAAVRATTNAETIGGLKGSIVMIAGLHAGCREQACSMCRVIVGGLALVVADDQHFEERWQS